MPGTRAGRAGPGPGRRPGAAGAGLGTLGGLPWAVVGRGWVSRCLARRARRTGRARHAALGTGAG
ncbi:MAG TPA: hypothetical protein VI365_28800, partial [Trebonia sp.]